MQDTTTGGARLVRAAAEQGDYLRAVTIAARMAPGMEPQLTQYRFMMEAYEQALAAGDRRKALRALADARLAAIAAELPELETVATNRLYAVVKAHELRRA
jgi:hypothetical protein